VKVLRFAIRFGLIFAGTAYAVGVVHANERAAELVSFFQNFCTPEPPDFAALDAKATGMKLSVRKDVTSPPRPDERGHVKSWIVLLASGRHELVATEARSRKGNLDSCGIGAEDVDGDDLRQELIKAMNLGAPLRQTVSVDGMQRLTTWKYADDDELFLADGTAARIPGIYLTWLHAMNKSR
jgi:hypothetical protein